MILSTKTIFFLKTFSTINSGLLVRPGNVLKIISQSKTLMAKVVLEQEFPCQFAICDLSRFTSLLGLFKEANVTFEENKLIITSNNQYLEYAYCDPKCFWAPPENDIVLKTRDVEFKLNVDVLKAVLQAASMLSVQFIGFFGDGKKIFMECLDVDNPTSDRFKSEVGDTNKTFRVTFKLENMKILLRNYDVVFCKDGFANFKSEDIEYYIAVESQTSNFGD